MTNQQIMDNLNPVYAINRFDKSMLLGPLKGFNTHTIAQLERLKEYKKYAETILRVGNIFFEIGDRFQIKKDNHSNNVTFVITGDSNISRPTNESYSLQYINFIIDKMIEEATKTITCTKEHITLLEEEWQPM